MKCDNTCTESLAAQLKSGSKFPTNHRANAAGIVAAAATIADVRVSNQDTAMARAVSGLTKRMEQMEQRMEKRLDKRITEAEERIEQRIEESVNRR